MARILILQAPQSSGREKEPIGLTNDPPIIRLAVLASGGGTTLQNFLDVIERGELNAMIAVVIASSANAGALDRATKSGIPAKIAAVRGRPVEVYSQEAFDLCRQFKADLVLLAGYLHLVQIPDDFRDRVMNIHPALIPAFCGKGYYGHKAHQAVLDRGAKVSGCTVHFADNQYDHGPIILQRCVPVLENDTADTLAARVFQAECQAFPEAVRLFAAGRLTRDGDRVRIGSQ